MSVARRTMASRCPLGVLVGILSVIGCSALTAPVRAAAPHYDDTMPLSQIKPGMKGYGLSVFKGTTVERFNVTILGILKKANPANTDHDLILIRWDGPPVKRGANGVQGMSGSPIYINGKVIGAYSWGEPNGKDPISMVTPIEDMLEAWDPTHPQQPTYLPPLIRHTMQPAKAGRVPTTGGSEKTSGKVGWNAPLDSDVDRRAQVIQLPQSITVGHRRLSKLVLAARADDPRHSQGDTAVLQRATTVLTCSGLREVDRAWLQKEFDRRGYAVTIEAGLGGGSASDFKMGPLKPGSAIGAYLATGDMDFGGFGTLTYRRGDRILAFGHPMFGLGPVEMALTTTNILDVFPGYQSSHKIGVPGRVIGTLTQDRNFSISGELGRMPRLIPFEVTINDATTHHTQTFHSNVFQHPDLTAVLLQMLASQAIARIHNIPGDVMARVTCSLDAEEVGRITHSNVVFDPADIASTAAMELNTLTAITTTNPFYPLMIRGGHMTVDITEGHHTATVERIFLKQGRYEPGDILDVGVVLKPYRHEAVTRTIAIKIPGDTPTGRYALFVRGGSASVQRIGPFIISGSSSDPQTPPVNVKQMVARLNEKETNTDLVTRFVLNTAAPALEGEKLSLLPPNLAALMRSERNSGVRLERDEIKTKTPTEYVVTGTQQLLVTVVRKNSQEPSSGANLSSPSSIGGPSGTPSLSTGGSGLSGASALEESALPSTSALEPLTLVESAETLRWKAALGSLFPLRADDGKETPVRAKKDSPKADTPQTDASKTSTPKTETAKPAPAPAASNATAGSTETNEKPEKPIGRQIQVWRQTARADFAAGKFTATSVTASGELRVAGSLHRSASTDETYIWALAHDAQGSLYAGTGTSGKILKIDRQSKITTFATLPVVAVHSLLMGKDGMLYAGSGVKGNLYRIAKDGAYTLLGSLSEKYILALAQDSKGNLFIGPGGGGTVYKLAPSSTTLIPYLKTPADHIMALTTDAQDNLYVGTGTSGVIYKVNENGKSSILYDAKENSVTVLATDPKGNLYAGTGPKGLLYRITPDGLATVIYDRATAFFTAMKAGAAGDLYASTVNAVYHIQSAENDTAPPVIQPLENPKDVDFLALDVTPTHDLVVGTGNVGELYSSVSASTPTTGVFESVVHDAKLPSRWGTARVEVSGAAHTQSVTLETRSGNVAEPDATWSAWSAWSRSANGPLEGAVTSSPARFIQYRLIVPTTTAVREVSIGYMPRNQTPKVTFTTPLGGERWAKSQTIKWNGSDPDGDTLTYELFYSTDAGATWKLFPTASKPDAKPGDTKPDATPNVLTPEAVAKQLEAYKKQLDINDAYTPLYKDFLLAKRRRELETGGNTTGGAALHETSRTWDTRTLPDGTYWLKVVASDYLSNPVDAQTAQAVSEPFVVCNAAPQIKIAHLPALAILPDKSLLLEGSVSQPLIAVTAVQYRVDGGDWIAAKAKDGLFDSSQQEFTLVTAPLSTGKHTVEVAAFNAAGTRTVEKAEITVP